MNTDSTGIIAIGIGGTGLQVINRMFDERMDGIELVGIDTDREALQNCRVHRLLQIGGKLMEGHGTNTDMDAGSAAAEESAREISAVLDGAKMIILIYGMGGGTGTGAACVIARLAREQDLCSVAIVARSLSVERSACIANAMRGIMYIRDNVDGLVIVPRDAMFHSVFPNVSIGESENMDYILCRMARSIAAPVLPSMTVLPDIGDVREVIKEKGMVYIGIGEGRGADRIRNAVHMAMHCPWQDVRLQRRDAERRILINISGDFDIYDLNEAVKYITMVTGENVGIILGALEPTADASDSCVVTIIATESEDPLEVFVRGM